MVLEMRKMKDSGIEWIGEIPEGWEVLAHKYIMHKEKSICEHYSGEDVISLTLNGVVKRDLENPSGKMPTTFDGYQFVDPNDLLLCLFDIDVTPRCVGLVKDYGVTSPAYSRFKIHSGFCNAYYNYLLRFIDDEKVFVHLSKNLRSSLTESDFGAIKTIVPPKAEQQRIADYLDNRTFEIDTLLSKARSSIEEYKKLKQAVITQAVTKGVRGEREIKESKLPWASKIPKAWNICAIRHIMFECKERTKDGHEEQLSVTQQFGIIKSSDASIANPSLSLDDWRIVAIGDIVFNKYKAHSGVFFVSPFSGIVTFNYSVYRCFPNCYAKYFEYQYKTHGCISEFRTRMHGVGNSISPLYTKDLMKIKVVCPPLDEQKEIADYLDAKCAEIDGLIAKKEQLVKELESYKKSLIYEVVTGKREV